MTEYNSPGPYDWNRANAEEQTELLQRIATAAGCLSGIGAVLFIAAIGVGIVFAIRWLGE